MNRSLRRAITWTLLPVLAAGCGILGPDGQRYATAYLEGTVRTESGAPVRNAQVLADMYDFENGACHYDEPGAPTTTFEYTDPDGRYRIRLRDLLAGERCVDLRVRAPNPELRDESVTGLRITVKEERGDTRADVVRADVVLPRNP